MVKVNELVGANVRNLRVGAGITQEEMADAMRTIGFSWHRPTVAENEAGRRQVTIEELPMLAAYFEMPVRALLVSPSSSMPAASVETAAGSIAIGTWEERVKQVHGAGWVWLKRPAPKATQTVYDEMMRGVDRPWATRWRSQGGGAIAAYRWAREQALDARTKLPGPAYLAEQDATVGYTIPPWGESEKPIVLKAGEVYVARDENEQQKLAESASNRNPAIRRITPQEAYRRRHR